MNICRLMEQLRIDEGTRDKPYVDTVGKLTIGVGRNLTDVGLSDGEIACLLRNDIAAATEAATKNFEWFTTLSEVRQEVVVNMLFNLGLPRFSGFKKCIAAIAAADYKEASVQMLDSRWARQVGVRAVRLANAMGTGQWQ